MVREYLEETGVTVKPSRLLGIRFNEKDWYAVFAVTYVEGEARSDGDENSEVIWMDIDEALKNETVPGLTKVMIECAIKTEGMIQTDYPTTSQRTILYTDLK